MGKSLYDLLSVDEDASATSIKNAYLRLKSEYEQNRQETGERHVSALQYQAISEAYAVLSTPKRRELYDQRLITERQQNYVEATSPAGFPFVKVLLLLVLVTMAGMGYFRYQQIQAEHIREQKRIELEQEQVKLKQEQLRLETENARRELEEMRLARQDSLLRERQIRQDRDESRRYAADVERMEEQERRRKYEEQRELSRLESERQRNERMSAIGPTYIGPTYIRR